MVPSGRPDLLSGSDAGYSRTSTLPASPALSSVFVTHIKGRTCSGLYKVTKSTYKFTEHDLESAPAMG